jgi:hypothetical protein
MGNASSDQGDRREDLQHVYTHPSGVERWRHLIEIVAISVAAIWAFYVFVYQEQIKPAHLAPSLEVKSRVSHTPMRGDNELITVELPEQNIGTVPLQIDAAIVNVYGVRFGPSMTKWSERGEASGDVSSHFYGLPVVSATLLVTRLTLYKSMGGAIASIFSPGREKAPMVNIAVRSGAYDAVRVEYSVCYQREDDVSPHPFHPSYHRDGSYDYVALANLEAAAYPWCPRGTAIVAI